MGLSFFSFMHQRIVWRLPVSADTPQTIPSLTMTRRTQQTPNKTSILTPDPPRVQSAMTIQPSTQKSERALGQA